MYLTYRVTLKNDVFFSLEIHKEESKLSSEKNTDETVIGEDGGEQVATPLPSSTAMQQFKKKKKTQAKRPGYARDSSMRKR